MMNPMKKIVFVFLLAAAFMQSFAGSPPPPHHLPLHFRSLQSASPLQLGSPLQNNMVIQQHRPFTVWGRAAAGETVQIRADWMPDAIAVKTGPDGNFLGIIPVPAVQAGDYSPHTLEVES